ncbi:23S rRNA (adenine(1618)-N(6))-methyltransferase RlmF [Zunongwangia endophytica]|uniref:Ribosomal RNA large subunit methyltransferase F n=1 Tax=Zunongwangia endophytica TaxID=1808945 RepID=A0ABV8HEM2_9FLAO|nr:23S rRNA (adenine(1618)-N(6))-methyltransferase RlmF [Zunongwangia endophytica]MDN3594666.1 23S rRNA (adenine(1618)-N(6))-methyltransferase RlmF [Zunongwangia endophytica]
MSSTKKQEEKSSLHPRNKNRKRYDLTALVTSSPELENYVRPNKYGDDSVDFSDPVAVKALNKALLYHYYGIKNWDFPDHNLCPPIPGRADYIHQIADLLAENNFGTIPSGDHMTGLDIGVGASCIYPIIGVTEYQWNFIGSDINPKSITSAKQIVNANPQLKDKIECRWQRNKKHIFSEIIGKEEKIDFTLCNPPFHSSSEDAANGTRRKVRNLSGKKEKNPTLNFAGINDELIYDGGEYKFIDLMIKESKVFSKNCFWFTTFVSKQANLKGIYRSLKKIEVNQIKTIPMGTGNKSIRIVAWTFFTEAEKKVWRDTRWKI